MNANLEIAREFMRMLRALRFPNPTSDADYEAMLEIDIKQLAQGAALLIEATAKALPAITGGAAASLEVRISNLEAMNDNLRTNNAALRELPKQLQPTIALLRNVIGDGNGCGHIAELEALVETALAETPPSVKGVALKAPRVPRIPPCPIDGDLPSCGDPHCAGNHRSCERCGAYPARFSEGQCQNCGEPSK